jgi:hypothetical protein
MHRPAASLVASSTFALVALPFLTPLAAVASAAADCDSRFTLEAEYYVFEAGDAPASIVTGDWNEDGIPDFATANAPTPKWGRAHSLSILLGMGGGFRLRTLPALPLSQAPRCIRSADLNGDGHADLVVAGDSGTSLWMGDGHGQFLELFEYPFPGIQIEIGDLDRDGSLDLAIVRPSNGFTVVLLHGWELAEWRDVPGYIPALKLGDFDEDGDLDVATGDPQGVAIRLNDGTGRFGAARVFTTPCGENESIGSLAVGHLDGDAHLDIVGIQPRSTGSCGVQLVGRGDGTFEARRALVTADDQGVVTSALRSSLGSPVFPAHVPASATLVYLADLGGDGVDEIVTLCEEHGREVMGQRSASLTSSAAFADVDGDGQLDVIVSSSTGVVVHPGTGDGRIRVDPRAAIHEPWASKMADVDGDGFQDVAVYSDGNFEIVHGAPGGFGPRLGPPGSFEMAFDFADIDGDGHLDVLSGGGEAILGRGGRQFAYPGIRFLDDGADAIASGDWNEDGKIDLAIVPRDAIGRVVLLTGDGRGGFQAARELPMRARRLEFADIDQDGHLDLFAGEFFAGAIAFGDGAGGFSGPVAVADPGFDPGLIRADFDEDGALDLAGDQAIFLRRGRVFQRVVTPSNAEAAGDLDGDGHADLVDAGHVCLGDGRGGFEPALWFGPSGSVFLDDRDRDGKLDLLVLSRDSEDGESSITWIPNRTAINHAPLTSGAVASLARSWPANLEWADVAIDGVRDPDGDPVAIEVTRIRQDEPAGAEANDAPSERASPARRDRHCPDAAIEHGRARVRLERDGDGNGRVYTLDFIARDACGAGSGGVATVCVPHHPDAECVDDGPRYDAMACLGHAVEMESQPQAIEGLRVRRAGPGAVTLEYAAASDEPVSLEIYDVSGRRLAQLEWAPLERGAHERTWTSAAGVYFARLMIGPRSFSKPIIIVR